MLDRPELGELSPSEKAETLSLLLIELQRRIGIELHGLLDKVSLRHFGILVEREAEPDEVAAFLSVRIPDYRERVEEAIEGFCTECRSSLDRLSSAV